MILVNRIHCLLFGHIWENDDSYPTHGYHDMPQPDSYCINCKMSGANYLKIKE